MRPEDAVEQACIRELRRRGGWGVQQTGVTLAGAPDWLGAYRGRALAWEFKAANGRVSRVQALRLRQAARAGAQAAVVRSVAEARVLLDELEGADLADGSDGSVRWRVQVA